MAKEKLISFARKIGIDYIGFSDINFSDNFVERLVEKRNNGHLSGFEEFDVIKRIDVKSLLKDAKTFISIAIPYKTIDIDYSKPYFSKSSMGIDYHKVVSKKLELIKNYLMDEFGANSVYYCDTGALHDREIAKKCGIGFYGKNTNIYTEKYGSYVFLGELITDMYIEPDIEKLSKCGECDICIKACPVGAIEKPYYVNSQKCLSYVTQKKELLTENEMNSMGLRIYGCDICQDACPFNKSIGISNIIDFLPNDWNININIEKFLTMSNKEFKETYGKISGGWRGKKILQRNLIIALGNSKRGEYKELIKKYMNDEYLNFYAKYFLKRLEE
ncbi:Epoxyqueuosine reductase [Caloramator mitchellensis]|uniref:Epoxyqueuosine reductase n=1 Tax=Caloramator mitchellensis TaxID=908809 RepID=A0A0R3JWP5_CALMK|nr:tRNA epoxyqueuosine(34) reductase QueG [Caloramator mitchellensis]KRQ88000.1 Epoxyqueuosine reductase [Caloramator mitchellensis]